VLHELATQQSQFLGSVGDASFNRQGSALAYTVDATVREGNGLFLRLTPPPAHAGTSLRKDRDHTGKGDTRLKGLAGGTVASGMPTSCDSVVE
jgi:hypothetical protein